MSTYHLFFALLALCIASAFAFQAVEENNYLDSYNEDEGRSSFYIPLEEDEIESRLSIYRPLDDDQFDTIETVFDEEDEASTCVTTDALRMRSSPSTSAKILTTLPKGTSVSKVGASGAWAKVNHGGRSGYMHGNYLRCGGSPSSARCNRTNFPQFLQCDSRWGNDRLGSKTICAIGCLMSSVSEALNGLGKKINGKAANPKVLNAWLKTHGGYSGNLFNWASVAPFGLHYQGKTSNHNDIRSKVCNKGYIVILAVHNQGHYVLATGVDGNGNYIVKDPGYSKKTIYTVGEVNLGAIYKV